MNPKLGERTSTQSWVGITVEISAPVRICLLFLRFKTGKSLDLTCGGRANGAGSNGEH